MWVNEVQKQEANIAGIVPCLFEKQQPLYDSCLDIYILSS